MLELRANQCLVCNFLRMLRCKRQIAPKKTQSLSCLSRNFRNMLTPFQAVSNSNSKVFGGLNLFQCLLMQRVVKVYLIALKRTKVVSFHRLLGTGMTSLIHLSPLLKCLMTVCPSLLHSCVQGTNFSPIRTPW